MHRLYCNRNPVNGDFFSLVIPSLEFLALRNSQLVPILFRSHAVYADRGLGSGMEPSRDNVFYYSMGRSIEEARTVVPNEE